MWIRTEIAGEVRRAALSAREVRILRTGFQVIALVHACWLPVPGLAQSGPALRLKKTIALPGVTGRLDHFALDAVNDRLFVCALENNSVEVVDLRRGERVYSITDLALPQGVACIPSLDRVLIANDRGGMVRIFDGHSFQQLGDVNLTDDADNVRYDDGSQKVFVGFGSGGIAIIDPAAGRQVESIKLSAHPEAFEVEKQGKRIYVNVPNSRHVAVIDREKSKVVATWKIDSASANFPMALDEARHRLFVGCRLPPKLVVLKTDSGEVVAQIDISGDADDVFYDSKRHRIYVVCGAGQTDIIEQTDADQYRLVAKTETANGARTGFFAPARDTLFVAIPRRGSQPAEIRCYEVR
jgi:DNA-binding beta-propeller fold protein YncE